mmetsp:Transcript_113834/g.367806  ORF Transcript_113834/g.367806 Transcript_113834/m.367806 type:complete len:244 (-) Transcript_113834:1074-1805(-)
MEGFVKRVEHQKPQLTAEVVQDPVEVRCEIELWREEFSPTAASGSSSAEQVGEGGARKTLEALDVRPDRHQLHWQELPCDLARSPDFVCMELGRCQHVGGEVVVLLPSLPAWRPMAEEHAAHGRGFCKVVVVGAAPENRHGGNAECAERPCAVHGGDCLGDGVERAPQRPTLLTRCNHDAPVVSQLLHRGSCGRRPGVLLCEYAAERLPWVGASGQAHVQGTQPRYTAVVRRFRSPAQRGCGH